MAAKRVHNEGGSRHLGGVRLAWQHYDIADRQCGVQGCDHCLLAGGAPATEQQDVGTRRAETAAAASGRFAAVRDSRDIVGAAATRPRQLGWASIAATSSSDMPTANR